ncbi:unnamed protein product [Caenorhabditis auriculariae]|uniref:Uncharacterized protein n=1 Tax=Caenorhabditis auriculariae TaxID=2777116 RepID=A0A8S1HSV4_9PELO|nr:unnamed protein product [Caenorhabditis auriculariae]
MYQSSARREKPRHPLEGPESVPLMRSEVRRRVAASSTQWKKGRQMFSDSDVGLQLKQEDEEKKLNATDVVTVLLVLVVEKITFS